MGIKAIAKIIFGSMAIAAPILLTAQTRTKAGAKTKPATTKTKTTATPAATAVMVDQPFQFTVDAKGFPDSTLALIVQPSNQQFQGPSGFVKNEKVVLQGTISHPEVYLLVLTDNKAHANDKYYNVYLDNEASHVAADSKTTELTVVSGPLMKTFDALLTSFGPHFDELTRINQMKQQAQATGQSVDSLNNRFSQITAQVNQQVPAFIAKYPQSPVSVYLLEVTRSIASLDQLQRNLDLLQGEAASNQRAIALKGYVQSEKDKVASEKLFAQGQPAPVFTQNDTLGKPVSLSSFKGKYVLVDFWASWCGPCRMENPNVVNAYNQYKDKNFTVLGVSLDQDKNRWMKAIHDDNLTWMHVSDLQGWGNAVAQQYHIQSIPQNLLIGPDGKIIAKNLRGGVLQAYLKDLLK